MSTSESGRCVPRAREPPRATATTPSIRLRRRTKPSVIVHRRAPGLSRHRPEGRAAVGYVAFHQNFEAVLAVKGDVDLRAGLQVARQTLRVGAGPDRPEEGAAHPLALPRGVDAQHD